VLSAVQVRAMLDSVARSHLAKLDRLAALETADGITADDGRVCDRVMGWARRLQASQGIAATVGQTERRVLTENGLTGEEIDEVARTLELLEALEKLPVVTAHIESREICLRRDILQKRPRPSARPRRQTKQAQES
jgi:hypothetical protein